MESKFRDGLLVVTLEEKVDTSNAANDTNGVRLHVIPPGIPTCQFFHDRTAKGTILQCVSAALHLGEPLCCQDA